MAEEKLPTRAEDFSEWYNRLVVKAQLADYRPHVVQVDSVVPRPAGADESVEQRGALGIAHETLPENARILLAGRAHRARDSRRGRSGNAPDAGYLYGLCRQRCRNSGNSWEKVRCREICRRGHDLFTRSNDGRLQSAAVLHVTFPGTKLRPSLRG